MQKLETIDEARTSDGSVLTLRRRGSEWLVFSGGVVLMSTRQHSSEEELAREAFARVRETKRVLIGGLGLGYTLRAALDELGPHAEVHVVELFGPLVTWNRTHLASLAAAPLEDPRVRVEVSDVAEVLARSGEEWDVILLDVDNGPEALTQASNALLYGKAGLLRARKALRRGGCLAVWSGGPSPAFAARLREVGFETVVLQARAHGRTGQRHTLFFGIRSSD